MLIFDENRIVISNSCRSQKRPFLSLIPDEPGGRDYQRKKIYDAEARTAKDAPLYVATMPQDLIDGPIALMVYRLVSDKRFIELFGKISADIFVIHKTARSRAYGSHKIVYCANGAICGYDILHEIAHLVTPRTLPAHGCSFASALLAMVKIAIPIGYTPLVQHYKELNVRFVTL